HDAVCRNGHRDITQRGVGWIARNRCSIRVGQNELRTLRNECIRRSRADIKAAQILLATLIEALEGGCHFAAQALNVLRLEAEAKNVSPFFARLQPMHAVEVAVFE